LLTRGEGNRRKLQPAKDFICKLLRVEVRRQFARLVRRRFSEMDDDRYPSSLQRALASEIW
jgi:23S rRNA U2552 (ribose-2'-O)-methylase RlmE/FtsJ